MKESLVFPGFESLDTSYNNNSSFGLDPQINFTEFLEEARRYANENQKEGEEICSTKKQVTTNEEKKCRKKSWKNALLFSIWRSSSSSSDKKANNKQQHYSKENSRASHNATNLKPRGHFSGPVHGGLEGAGAGKWSRRLAGSGPVAGLFQKRWKEKKGNEIGIQYVSLERLNQPIYDAKAYGPVYLVS